MSLLRNFRTSAPDAEMIVPAYWDHPPAPSRPPVWKRLPVLILAAGTAYLSVGLALTLGPDLRKPTAEIPAEQTPAEVAGLPQPAAETLSEGVPELTISPDWGKAATAQAPLPPMSGAPLAGAAATPEAVATPPEVVVAAPAPDAVATPPEVVVAAPAPDAVATPPEVVAAAPALSMANDLAAGTAAIGARGVAQGDPDVSTKSPAAPSPVASEAVPVALRAAPPRVPRLASPAPMPPEADTRTMAIRLGTPLSPVKTRSAASSLPVPEGMEPLAIDTRPAASHFDFALDAAPDVSVARSVVFPPDVPRDVTPGAALAWEPLAEPKPTIPVKRPEMVAEDAPQVVSEDPPVASAVGHRVVVHANGSLFDDARAAQSILAQAGYDTSFAPANRVRQNSVRFFHRDDAAAARAAADRLGVGLVLMMDIPSPAPPGTLEVWLANPLGLQVGEADVGGDVLVGTAVP